MELKLVDFNSELWAQYCGAFGNVYNDLKVLMEQKPELPEREQKWYWDMYQEWESDLRIAFDNICEQLSHQMSFYSASYLVLPYLVKLYEKWQQEADFRMQGMLLAQIGIILATDVPYNHGEWDSDIPEEILESYNQSIAIIQEKAKEFLAGHMAQIKQVEQGERSMFGVGMLAILGDREAAFMLTLGAWSQCLQYCPNCETLDEDTEIDDCLSGLEEKAELERKIKPAESVIGQWDGVSFDNTYLWFSNLLYEMGNKDEAEKLRYFYGTYTCPKCGRKGAVMEQAKLAYIEG